MTEALNNGEGICNSMMTCISEGGDFCCCMGLGFYKISRRDCPCLIYDYGILSLKFSSHSVKFIRSVFSKNMWQTILMFRVYVQFVLVHYMIMVLFVLNFLYISLICQIRFSRVHVKVISYGFCFKSINIYDNISEWKCNWILFRHLRGE